MIGMAKRLESRDAKAPREIGDLTERLGGIALSPRVLRRT